MRTKYLVAAVAVLLAAAALAWLLLARTSPPTGAGGPGTGAPPAAKPAQVIASIEVEGRGSVLANGTSTLFWNSTKPFALRLEARPEACWVFKGWLVNGTPYSGEANATLFVKGNTTVKAVFERPVYAVSLVPAFHPATLGANASARINGTLHPLPVNASAPACSLLEVEPVAPRGWEALNGTIRFTVNGSTVLYFAFEKVAAVLKLRSEMVPVKVSGVINGSPTGFTAGGRGQPEVELAVAPGSHVLLEPAGDRKGCVLYNDTHLACFDGWVVNGTRYGGLQLGFTARGDTVIEVRTVVTKKQHPVAYTEVILPNGSLAKAPVIPTEQYMVVPFIGEYEYVGNGWFKIKGLEKTDGAAYQFVIILPEGWRRIRVTANYTRVDRRAATPSIEVVCKHVTVGNYLMPSVIPGSETNVIVFDRGLVECVGDLRVTASLDFTELKVARRCYAQYVQAERGTLSLAGGGADFFNVPVGSLLVSGQDGIIYLKIEILEMGG
jgi:hypothetical protein